MFRDECEFEVRAGRGGDGLVSFRREKYVQMGGPDGGNGGNGGSVILVATSRVSSLLTVGRRSLYKAQNGRPGGPRNKSGANGDDCTIEVPVGTQVLDKQRGHLLRDLAEDGTNLVVAAGGRGGRGNAMFATAQRQAPRQAERGRDGEVREVELRLKIFAEVGLVGLPNAGKSTLLSATSAATPKVADYPFTTLHPQVGIVRLGVHETLVMADLPGLIEGAAAGAGLGHRFLRHVERCRCLLHLVDCSVSFEEALEAARVVERELQEYSAELAQRPRLLVATKVEDDAARACAVRLGETLEREAFAISSVKREGLDELLQRAYRVVREARGGAAEVGAGKDFPSA